MKQFFQDGTGALSMMRLCQFLVVVVVLFVFLEANIVASVNAVITKTVAAPIIDFREQMIFALLVIIGGKVAQTVFGEKQEEKPTSPPA